MSNKIGEQIQKETHSPVYTGFEFVDLNVSQTPPSIFDYDDYRRFLHDYYIWKKTTQPTFSHRGFIAKLGYRSPSFLNLVMTGRRNLTEDGVERFSKALALSDGERVFFRNLVDFNQTKVADEKRRLAREMVRSKIYKTLRPLDEAKFEYWDKWYHVAIHEMIGLYDFQENPAWIAQQLVPKISPDQAKVALETLWRLKLVSRDDQGKLIRAPGNISSGDQITAASIGEFHRQMIQKGKDAVDLFRAKDRLTTSVSCSLSEEGESQIRNLLLEVQRQICAIAEREKDSRRIVQINVQCFPLTKRIGP